MSAELLAQSIYSLGYRELSTEHLSSNLSWPFLHEPTSNIMQFVCDIVSSNESTAMSETACEM